MKTLLETNSPKYLRRLVRELNAQKDGFHYRDIACSGRSGIASFRRGSICVRALNDSDRWAFIELSEFAEFEDAYGRTICASRT